MRLRLKLIVAVVGFVWISPCQTATPVIIQDVRLFDGEQVFQHRSVLIANGKIARVADSRISVKGAEMIDGQAATLLPGLFDSHAHTSPNPESALRQSLSFGVTTVLDMFANPSKLEGLKEIQSADSPLLSDVRMAGLGAAAPGGHPAEMGGAPFPTITGPEQAPVFVEARVQEGSDYIKIIYDDLSAYLPAGRRFPMLSYDTMAALIQAAHQRGKLAVVHIGTERQARDAIQAGADGLAHMFTGEEAGSDFGKFVAVHRVFVIPTLVTLFFTCGESTGPAILQDPFLKPFIRPEGRASLEQVWPYAKASCKGTAQGVRQLEQSGVPVLAGTDAPMPGTAHGVTLHEELEQLVTAGLTPLEALQAATSRPARAFHLEDRGLIRAGLRADLVLVKGDPATDIRATRNIIAIWKRGIRLSR